MKTYGLDVSKHQGTLKFDKIAEDNDFVILRIGYGVTYLPKEQKDIKFEEYYKKATDAGLHIGGYYYSYAYSVDQAKKEAENCLKYIDGKSFDFPIYYDMEDPSIGKKCSSATIKKMVEAFCKIITDAGYRAGVYASTSWFKSHGIKDVNSKYTRWEANYGKNNDGKTVATSLYNKSVPIHQYTSKYKTSKYSGKSQNFDRNINYSIVAETRPTKEVEKEEEPAETIVSSISFDVEDTSIMTAQRVVDAMIADHCNTQSRSKNGKYYTNKYTQNLGKHGYPGINAKTGKFTKFYSYGAVGHCCAGAQSHLIDAGYETFVPHNGSYIWNTNVYHRYLKKQPTFSGYGKAVHTTNYKEAKVGAIAFTSSHTCVVRKTSTDGYVYTVDFNVSGKGSDGKTYNNGTLNKRKASKFNGFVNLPYKTSAKKSVTINVGEEYTLTANMNARSGHSTSDKINSVIKSGSKIMVTNLFGDSTQAWAKTSDGWICIKMNDKVYISL